MKAIILILLTVSLSFAAVIKGISQNFCNGTTQILEESKNYWFKSSEDGYRVIQGVAMVRDYGLINKDLSYNDFYWNPYADYPDYYYLLSNITNRPNYDTGFHFAMNLVKCETPQTSCNNSDDTLTSTGLCIPKVPQIIEPILPKCSDNEVLRGYNCVPLTYNNSNYYVKSLIGGFNKDTFCKLGTAGGYVEETFTYTVPVEIKGLKFEKTRFTKLENGEILSIPFIVKDKNLSSTEVVTAVKPSLLGNKIDIKVASITCLNCPWGKKKDGSCVTQEKKTGVHLVPSRNPPDGWERTNRPDEYKENNLSECAQTAKNCLKYQEMDYNKGILYMYDYKEPFWNNGKKVAYEKLTHRYFKEQEEKDKPNYLNLCEDGGPLLYGSCDRSCEDVNMVTMDNNTLLLEDSLKNPYKCVPQVNCEEYMQSCAEKCGSIANILNMNCSENDNRAMCQCKGEELPEEPPTDDPKDDVYDDETPEEQDQEEEEVNNEGLSEDGKQAKNDNKKTRDRLEKMHDDLREGNEALNDQLKQANKGINKTNDRLKDIYLEQNQTNDLLGQSNEHLSNIEDGIDKINDRNERIDEANAEANSNTDSAIEEAQSKEDEATAQNENYRDNFTQQGDNLVSSIDSVLTTVQNGFTFTPPPNSNVSNTIHVFNKDITFDACPILSKFSYIFSLLMQAVMLFISIKIFILGFRLAKQN